MFHHTFLIVVILLMVGNLLPVKGQQNASTSAETLTLEQAIALGLKDNRQAKNADIEVNKYTDKIAETRTLRLPSFTFNALASQLITPLDFKFEKGVFGDIPGTGPIPDKDTTISTPRKPTLILNGQISQPLSQLYRINLNIKQATTGREIAEQQSRAQKQSVIAQVKRAYYAILQTQSSLNAIAESLNLYRELDRVTGEYVVQQVALKSESLDVKTRLAKAQYEAFNLSNTLATQKEQLNNLLGRDINTEFDVSAGLETASVETELAMARRIALEQRPEIKEAQLKIKQAELDRRIKKSERIPDVSLSLNYLSLQSFNSILPKSFASVGVAISWDVFDWSKRKHQLSEKDSAIEQAKNNLRESENLVLIEVNNRYRQLQQTNHLLRIAQLSQETERENLRVAINKYNLKAALLKDALEVQNRLAEANNQYQQALISFWTAKAEFEKAIGEDK